MKKFILMFALMISAFVGVNAQTAIQTPKFLDNWSVGAEVGATTPLDFNSVMPLNVNAGLVLHKQLTSVWGMEVEALTWFGDNHFNDTKNFVKALNLGGNVTTNLTNLFLGYKGTPRTFEVGTNVGLGWLHSYNANANDWDNMSAKTGLDFIFNLGNAKQFALVVSPTVFWNLNNKLVEGPSIQMTKNAAQLAVDVKFLYRFKTSNGTHNFKVWNVGALNDEINTLRADAELAKKPKTVAKTVTNTVEKTVGSWTVFFAKGSAEVVDMPNVPSGTVVDVVGHASEEGSVDFNQKLSEDRANAVAEALKANGVTVNSVSGEGKTGTPQNRVAIITAK